MYYSTMRIKTISVYLLFLIAIASISNSDNDANRIRPYEANPFYWQYKGQPVMLLGGTGQDNLFNHPDSLEPNGLESHLDLLASVGGNAVRNTMSSRDEQNVFPFAQLEDGRYDLDRLNPEYWERFERFLRMTAERDIIVQIEFWDPWDAYAQQWERNPWNPANNINYTSEDTRLVSAYSPPQYRGGMSYGEPHDFFMTPPALHDDRLVLERQQRFVEAVLTRALEYPHILYCVSNEIHPQYPPEWGWYWASFIRDYAQEAGKHVSIAEMYWVFDFQHEQHRASLDRPDVYDFFEASQNSAILDAEANWRNLQSVRQHLLPNPRPINNTKIYGADSGPAWAGDTDNAIDQFWRNVIGGAASARFHRPPAGLGLSEDAQASIRSARMFSEVYDLFRAAPDAEHHLLLERGEDDAYLSYISGEAYALYFPTPGETQLNLSGVEGAFSLKWLDIAASRWMEEERVEAGAAIRLRTPGEGRWAAVIERRDS